MAETTDHDLLIRLTEQVRSMDAKLTAHLEDNGGILRDHETRIRRLELIGGIALGVVLLVEFVAKTNLLSLIK
jgi:hypothetical protein